MSRGEIYHWQWVPAIVGIGYFYLTSESLDLIFLAGLTAIMMSLATWATLKIAHRKNEDSALIGKGDYLVIILFSFWPDMVVLALTLGLLVGITGFHYRIWNRGLRGIPLAGLMGLFCIMYCVFLAL
jgi:hypothetical protein